MSMRTLFCASIAVLTSFAAAQDVLADGKPPLTQEIADKYVRFMGWALDVPLTKVQEERLKNYLVDTWKSGDTVEIDRTLMLLATRDRLEKMGLQQDRAAQLSVRKRALYSWNRNPMMPSASWGIAFTAAATRPVVKGPPPLTKQAEDAYEEMAYFLIEQAFGAKPTAIDAMQRVQLYDSLARSFGAFTSVEKSNFAQLPAVWAQIRRAWPTLSESDRSAVGALVREQFSGKSTAGAVGKGKRPTPAPPVGKSEDLTLSRLLKMSWLASPEVFGKLAAIGGPDRAYGSGW